MDVQVTPSAIKLDDSDSVAPKYHLNNEWRGVSADTFKILPLSVPFFVV